MTEIFSTIFQNKQSNQELKISPICFPNRKLIYFAFTSSAIKSYLKVLNLHDGLDSHNIFSLFLNKMAVFLAAKLSKIFLELIVACSLPVVWRTKYISPIRNGSSPSQLLLNYRPILIMLNISKVYKTFMSQRLLIC